MRDRRSLRGEPSSLDAPCSRCGWRRRTRCTDRRLRNARGDGSAVGAPRRGKGFASEKPSAENKQRCARARAGLPSELQNHAAGAPLQFSQFFPVISRVCVRGRGKSRGSKRVCRGALVSGNASTHCGKSAVRPIQRGNTRAAVIGSRIFEHWKPTQLHGRKQKPHNPILWVSVSVAKSRKLKSRRPRTSPCCRIRLGELWKTKRKSRKADAG
jgi:hypothetical protein